MLSAEIISALIMLSQWIKPRLNRLFDFIVEVLEGEDSNHLKIKLTIYINAFVS